MQCLTSRKITNVSEFAIFLILSSQLLDDLFKQVERIKTGNTSQHDRIQENLTGTVSSEVYNMKFSIKPSFCV